MANPCTRPAVGVSTRPANRASDGEAPSEPAEGARVGSPEGVVFEDAPLRLDDVLPAPGGAVGAEGREARFARRPGTALDCCISPECVPPRPRSAPFGSEARRPAGKRDAPIWASSGRRHTLRAARPGPHFTGPGAKRRAPPRTHTPDELVEQALAALSRDSPDAGDPRSTVLAPVPPGPQPPPRYPFGKPRGGKDARVSYMEDPLAGRLDPSRKQETRAVYRHLLGSYQRESARCQSAAAYCDTVLKQVRVLVDPAHAPDALLTATASMLLVKLCASVFKRFEPVLMRLLGVLFRSAYTDYDTTSAAPQNHPPEHGEPRGDASTGNERLPDEAEGNLADPSRFIDLTLHADVAKEVSSDLAWCRERSRRHTVSQKATSKIMSTVVSKWQGMVCACVFRTWRREATGKKAASHSLSNLARSSRRRKAKYLHFFKWKLATAVGTHRRFALQASENTGALLAKVRLLTLHLAARERDVAKLKLAKANLREKNAALSEMLRAEKEQTGTLLSRLRDTEGRGRAAADLLRATMDTVDGFFDSVPRAGLPSIERALAAAAGGGARQQATPPGVVDQLHGVLAEWLSANAVTWPEIDPKALPAEARTLKHLAAVAQALAAPAHDGGTGVRLGGPPKGHAHGAPLNVAKASEPERAKCIAQCLNAVGCTYNLRGSDVQSCEGQDFLQLLCNAFVRFTHRVAPPSAGAAIPVGTTGVNKPAEKPDLDALVEQRDILVAKMRTAVQWQRAGWLVHARAQYLASAAPRDAHAAHTPPPGSSSSRKAAAASETTNSPQASLLSSAGLPWDGPGLESCLSSAQYYMASGGQTYPAAFHATTPKSGLPSVEQCRESLGAVNGIVAKQIECVRNVFAWYALGGARKRGPAAAADGGAEPGGEPAKAARAGFGAAEFALFCAGNDHLRAALPSLFHKEAPGEDRRVSFAGGAPGAGGRRSSSSTPARAPPLQRLLFDHIARQHQPDDDGEFLPFHGFVRLLVTLTLLAPPAGLSPAPDRVASLVSQLPSLLRESSQVDLAAVVSLYSDEKAADLLKVHRSDVKSLFTRYSSVDCVSTDSALELVCSAGNPGFPSWSPHLAINSVLFASSALATSAVDFAAGKAASSLSYRHFCQLLVLLAAVHTPDPFLSASSKLRFFMKTKMPLLLSS
ncbi:hypothetical protein DIPPA_14478 [Diplonema papillatum]|nr:hypothetical protein DIPPA_14478 [Diplonema papillatum]